MGVVLPGFPWPIILRCLALSPHLAGLRVLPSVGVHLLAKMDSSARVSGKLIEHITIWHILPSLSPLFCACVIWEVSLTSRMRNMWSLYLLSKQDSAPPCSCHYLYLGVSEHRWEVQAAQIRAHPSPVSNLPWEMWTPRNLYWEDEGWRSIFFRLAWGPQTRPNWGHGTLTLSCGGTPGWLLVLFQQGLFWGVAGIPALSCCALEKTN